MMATPDHDDDNDPIKCCILEICCLPDDALAALAKELARLKTPQAQAAWLKKTFDFAPKGTITPLLQRAAAMGYRGR